MCDGSIRRAASHLAKLFVFADMYELYSASVLLQIGSQKGSKVLEDG